MRKPAFGVCDEGRLKPACTATEARLRFEISDIETRGIILSRQRTTAPLLFAYCINRFSHDVAHMFCLSRVHIFSKQAETVQIMTGLNENKTKPEHMILFYFHTFSALVTQE